jgi:D-proline reductase (dithiol) PrdB
MASDDMASDHVRYIDKTREYYRSEGYDKPYRWAHFDDVPFTPLARPLSECRVGLVTTSEMAVRGVAEPVPDDDPLRNPYWLASDTPIAELYSLKVAYDRYATTLDDVDSYLPLTRLAEAAAEGRIAARAPRFQVAFSQYSQRKTLGVDAPMILDWLREDRVDVAVLTAV